MVEFLQLSPPATLPARARTRTLTVRYVSRPHAAVSSPWLQLTPRLAPPPTLHRRCWSSCWRKTTAIPTSTCCWPRAARAAATWKAPWKSVRPISAGMRGGRGWVGGWRRAGLQAARAAQPLPGARVLSAVCSLATPSPAAACSGGGPAGLQEAAPARGRRDAGGLPGRAVLAGGHAERGRCGLRCCQGRGQGSRRRRLRRDAHCPPPVAILYPVFLMLPKDL